MSLQVIGSGLGRTGTMSLKTALEQLLGAPSYHMIEVFGHADHPELWTRALDGDTTVLDRIMDGYAAAVDWPACAFWKELATANPDALILHSERPATDWFRSANNTIFVGFQPGGDNADADANPWNRMAHRMLAERFTPDFLDRDAAMAAFDAWNADVKATADPDRLLIWQTGEGWEPICDRLGIPVPDAPFPHTNTTEEFRARRA